MRVGPGAFDGPSRAITGAPVQYSVYYGQFSERDLVVLRERLKDELNLREDQVLFVRIGVVGDEEDAEERALRQRIELLGRPWEPRDLRVMVF